MQKLSAFVGRCLNANGPAQIVSYSFWGVLVSGMMWDFCNDHLPNVLLAVWGLVSFGILPVAIWCSKTILKNLLLVDMFLSAIVLSIFTMHDPHYVSQMVYNVKASGEYVKLDHTISEWFNAAALVWMTLHSAYLADLLRRQILEMERFRNEL